MKSTKKIEKVINILESKKTSTEAVVHQVRQKITNEQNKMTKLEQFYNEYCQSIGKDKGLTPSQYQNSIGFVNKIQTAKTSQQQALNRSEAELVKVRQEWLSINSKINGLKKMVEEQLAEEQKAADKKEQTTTEEFLRFITINNSKD